MGHPISGGDTMAKQGMARPDRTKTHPKNTSPAVPQIQGKARYGKAKAVPIIQGTCGPNTKVYHERPISQDAYPAVDNDLARDNLENDIPWADLEDIC